MIIGGSASQKLGAEVANELGEYLCPIETKKFPDGERYIRIKGNIEEKVVVIQSTGYPQDENLIELLLIIKNLKSLGAKEIKVVIPYFGYGRQEKRFKEGEAISAEIIANLIQSSGANEVISIDLHEDSVRNFFNIPSKNISATGPIADYIANKTNDPIIIAPDKGALGFAEEISKILECDSSYLNKVRISPEKVETQIADIAINSVKGKDAFVVDDIIATGGTIVNAIAILKKHGAKSVSVCCVHPILVNDAILKIYAAGAKSIAGTDSLKSEVSCISVAKIIADAVR
ncbi:MAG: ribose-phosphate diphosphokinase [Methanobrevibacter sp.]|nr:ribose-phosphate diphosphokinase [Methanobrevibacter sp.]